MTLAPPAPTPNAEALAWLNARFPIGTVVPIELLRVDAPECVKAWLAARDRWEAQRAELPIDYASDRDAWRMFGGEWITGHEMVWLHGGNARLHTAALNAAKRLPADEFRTWAQRVYEARRMVLSAQDRLYAEAAR